MLERDVEVMNANGIHARPAAEIVKLASKFTSQITLGRDGTEVNGKSIMGVMMLAAECGAVVRIRCEGADEAAALDALVELVGSTFGEH
ncbi:MAG: HPr family phosphocarrier protein [Gemmatimonadaceae bacterium]|nr:HPr family phosphocarrier protein [Gemmatimonadaceae bacterium]